MNTVQVVNQLSTMPDGVGVEMRRQRVTVLLGVALALAVALPTAPIESSVLRNYFQEQTTALRNVMFEINEALPFDVDRSAEYGFRLYERRYALAFYPKINDVLNQSPFQGVLAELVPERDKMGIEHHEVVAAIEILTGAKVQ